MVCEFSRLPTAFWVYSHSQIRKRNELGNEERVTCSVGLAPAPYLATRNFTSSFSCCGRGCNNIRIFRGGDYDILHRKVPLWGSRAIYSNMFLERERGGGSERESARMRFHMLLTKLLNVVWWAQSVGNPDKTGLVAFRRRKLPGFFEPHLLGMTLHCSISVKYLGMILDSWLTWREHVDVKER